MMANCVREEGTKGVNHGEDRSHPQLSVPFGVFKPNDKKVLCLLARAQPYCLGFLIHGLLQERVLQLVHNISWGTSDCGQSNASLHQGVLFCFAP